MQTGGIIFEFIPRWLELAIAGPLLVYFIVAACIVLAKAGRHPAWSLLLLIPFIQLIMIWAFALSPWPRQGEKEHE